MSALQMEFTCLDSKVAIRGTYPGLATDPGWVCLLLSSQGQFFFQDLACSDAAMIPPTSMSS